MDRPLRVIHRASADLTKQSDKAPVRIVIDDAARLREIRALVAANNKSELSDDLIICQVYMESRFDAKAAAPGGARGLMQMKNDAVRELYRVENLSKRGPERVPEPIALERGARFHASDAIFDEATNLQLGTRYLQILIDRQRAKGVADPIAEAYKRYRGVANGIYYGKIKGAAEKLTNDPESMRVLREMVK